MRVLLYLYLYAPVVFLFYVQPGRRLTLSLSILKKSSFKFNLIYIYTHASCRSKMCNSRKFSWLCYKIQFTILACSNIDSFFCLTQVLSTVSCCHNTATHLPVVLSDYHALHEQCIVSRYGCCLDGYTLALGPDYAGCVLLEATHSCLDTQYGCCLDGQTASQGPFFLGCPSTVHCKVGPAVNNGLKALFRLRAFL